MTLPVLASSVAVTHDRTLGVVWTHLPEVPRQENVTLVPLVKTVTDPIAWLTLGELALWASPSTAAPIAAQSRSAIRMKLTRVRTAIR